MRQDDFYWSVCQCNECSLAFAIPTDIYTNRVIGHKEVGLDLFKCPRCGKEYNFTNGSINMTGDYGYHRTTVYSVIHQSESD